ncbi:MAG: cytochrome c maturation protein CcmE [Actinomycetota bacterium]|nr:cytochrome c maturation protein CcmE [Actinomycetota bacterium]
MEPSSTPEPSKRRAKFLVGGSVVFVAVVGLLFFAMTRPGSTAFYLTPTEIQALGSTSPESSYRLNGTVVPGSIETSGLETAFVVTDGSTEIAVVTDRPVPDTFKDRSEVVVRGAYDGDTFVADQVLAKCPSKFKAKKA